MARTTLVLEDKLFREIKHRAASEGRTFQAVANELLRRALHHRQEKPYRLKLEGWKAELRAGVDICNRNTLFDVLDQE